jgi:hypothetical protein
LFLLIKDYKLNRKTKNNRVYTKHRNFAWYNLSVEISKKNLTIELNLNICIPFITKQKVNIKSGGPSLTFKKGINTSWYTFFKQK